MSSPPAEHSSRSVLVVGGGLAGIAAAVELRKRGLAVTLAEARPRLGGRATSYVDQQSGEVIDNCQHVSMGCCTNLAHLCRTLGLTAELSEEKTLYFVAPDGRVTPFGADPLPAPLHLSRAFLRLPYLSFREKRLFASAVRALARAEVSSLAGVRFDEWLRAHHQSDSLIRNVWEVVLVSALSESLERIDARYARKVFVDGFLTHPRAWRVQIPAVSLDELYSGRADQALKSLGVQILPGWRAKQVQTREGRVHQVLFRGGERLSADEFVLAVPHHQVPGLLPDQFPVETVRKIERIESAPITSVHLWFDRPITDLPHAVFVGRLSQWLFARGTGETGGGGDGETSAGGYRYQVVISASRNLEGPRQGVIERVCRELQGVWPAAAAARLLHSRVLTERRAVFSVTPGIDEFRPMQQSPVPNLQFAGDWTQTGWPATMEGAVRSGYLAAENVLRNCGLPEPIVQPELPVARLARWLFGAKRGIRIEE